MTHHEKQTIVSHRLRHFAGREPKHSNRQFSGLEKSEKNEIFELANVQRVTGPFTVASRGEKNRKNLELCKIRE